MGIEVKLDAGGPASRRDFVKTALAGIGVSPVAAWLTGCGGAARKPNFVFFLVDDLGWADLGCYGSTYHESPHIDALAAKGMRFTNAYAACPVCSPTRASIMTGKYPARLKLTNFIPGRHLYQYSKLTAPEFSQQLPLEEVTIAEVLMEAGYTTGHIGKWHLGDEGFLPQNQGFDSNVGGTRSGMPKSFFYPQWEDNPPVRAEDGEYLTDRLTKHAEAFLEQNRDRPFFLYFPYYNVHIPLEAKAEYVANFEAKSPGETQRNPVYAGMIRSVDDSVGRVMAKLEELGIADRTVLIFMSDNGGLHVPEWRGQIATSNAPLREGKGYLYEGGIREPMIICWPGVTKPGSVCDDPVTSTDFFPTMAEIAGIREHAGQPVDGVSLVPLLEGTGTLERQAIYWHYPHYSNQGGKPGGAIRQGDFKLIEFYEGPVELYNLREDPGELHDLADRMPEKVTELKASLAAWREEVAAVMPAPNPGWDPKREWEGNRWMPEQVGRGRG